MRNDIGSPADTEQERSSLLGDCLRGLRNRRGLTLVAVSKLTGISISTLSKVENHQLSLTYDKLLQLANGLGADISELFTQETHQRGKGWRSFNPPRVGASIPTPNYDYRYLCADLSSKKMIPITATVRARSMDEFGDFVRHSGEEFVYIIKGDVLFCSEFYKPLPMPAGSSIYFDARMGHAYLNSGEAEAEILCICSSPESELDSVMAKMLAEDGQP